MITLYYSRQKLVLSGAFLLLGAPVVGMVCLLGDPLDVLFGLALIVGGPLLSAGRLGRLFGDLKAIEYDDWNISLYPLGTARKLRWRDVAAIEVGTKLRTFYGFFPIGREHTIKFSFRGGASGTGKANIPFSLLALDKTAVIARLTDMEKRRGGDGFVTGAARVSKKALTQALAAPADDLPPASDFDADAIMARYLAQREVGALVEDEAPSPIKVPPPLPPLPPRMPPRVAGFGRKRG